MKNAEEKKMVELSFDLDERICKMIEEMPKEENKSESEVVMDAIRYKLMHTKDEKKEK